MVSPLSTENPTPGELISNRLASSLSDIPNSLTAQKQKRLLALTFRCCLPLTASQKVQLLRCAASFVTAAYHKYASFLRICAP